MRNQHSDPRPLPCSSLSRHEDSGPKALNVGATPDGLVQPRSTPILADGDSNFLFDQSVNDISASFVEPALEGLLRASIGDNDVELHLPLLRGLPHLARTGDGLFQDAAAR